MKLIYKSFQINALLFISIILTVHIYVRIESMKPLMQKKGYVYRYVIHHSIQLCSSTIA